MGARRLRPRVLTLHIRSCRGDQPHKRISSAWRVTPVLEKMCSRWVFAVGLVMPSVAAYTNRVAPYDTFLRFLGQMADRRAFEPAVFVIIELPAGLKPAGKQSKGTARQAGAPQTTRVTAQGDSRSFLPLVGLYNSQRTHSLTRHNEFGQVRRGVPQEAVLGRGPRWRRHLNSHPSVPNRGGH
jgi:hypothetical protein